MIPVVFAELFTDEYRAKGRPWTLFGNTQKFRVGYRGLSEPKPDWVAYFPIYNFIAGDRIPTTTNWRFEKSPKGCMVQNFSMQTLQALAEHGLQPTARAIFREGRRDNIKMSDLICYPWLIVEHKKSSDQGKDLFCYCQAANAGMGALMMLKTLAKYAERRVHDEHIPPVITITTVECTVRVWVMYVDEGADAYVSVGCRRFSMSVSNIIH
jgi:hypothetical protein